MPDTLDVECMYGYADEICDVSCGCRQRLSTNGPSPVPIEKVSEYDRSIPLRVRVPFRSSAVAQASQLSALRNRLYRYIRSHYGRRQAIGWLRLVDAKLKDQTLSYDVKRKHLEYLANVFIDRITEEVEEIIKGAE